MVLGASRSKRTAMSAGAGEGTLTPRRACASGQTRAGLEVTASGLLVRPVGSKVDAHALARCAPPRSTHPSGIGGTGHDPCGGLAPVTDHHAVEIRALPLAVVRSPIEALGTQRFVALERVRAVAPVLANPVLSRAVTAPAPIGDAVRNRSRHQARRAVGKTSAHVEHVEASASDVSVRRCGNVAELCLSLRRFVLGRSPTAAEDDSHQQECRAVSPHLHVTMLLQLPTDDSSVG